MSSQKSPEVYENACRFHLMLVVMGLTFGSFSWYVHWRCQVSVPRSCDVMLQNTIQNVNAECKQNLFFNDKTTHGILGKGVCPVLFMVAGEEK